MIDRKKQRKPANGFNAAQGVYLVVVQRGVVAQGADGCQLNKAVICTAVDLAASLGAESEDEEN